MKLVLVCPNAFKGSVSAAAAADAIEEGLLNSGKELDIQKLPIADGGDGTLEVLINHFTATMIPCESIDPLGRKINVKFGFSQQTQTAIIELPEASGIRHLKSDELNPWQANTYGTGILIDEALKLGARKIILTLGGSASVEGGMGILEALGARFLASSGNVISNVSPKDFLGIREIDVSKVKQRLEGVTLDILCDVENPLLGEQGAPRVFGPQKGASSQDVVGLERALEHLSLIVNEQTGKDITLIKHGGAAGGISAFLYGLLDANLVDGADAVLKYCGFDEALAKADILITGEGKIDQQSLSGKGPGLVARRAKEHGKHVVGFCGVSDLGSLDETPFDEVVTINQPGESVEESIRNTKQNLIKAAAELAF